MVEQCTVVFYSKLKHGKRMSYGSCGTKSNYTTSPKFYFTVPNQPKTSFGTIYSVCGIIKRFTTTRKSCPGKDHGRKLKLTDRDMHLFRRYLSKIRHLADLVRWARQSFGKTISEASMHWYIKKCGYTLFKFRSKQSLITANKHRCFAWAKSHLTWNF